MPYRKVELKANNYYHIYNRGNNYQNIFFNRDNYLYFLRQLRKYFIINSVKIIAYCLMPNHYHFLVLLEQDDISQLMQKFSLSYTKAINKQFNYCGSLFQGRFKAIHVNTDEYLIHLSRYIHLNPVVAKLVKYAQDWEFSSYREYIGLRPGTLPHPHKILSYFTKGDPYQAFVETYQPGDRQFIKHLILE